jgi:predicted regulator of Ras-like GTPase activity (Roadblock/LC7/MglB family)
MDGVDAAAFISREGLVVSWQGEKETNRDGLAAQAAAVMDSGAALGGELAGGGAKTIALRFENAGALIVPVNDDLSLLLLGRDLGLRGKLGSFF